MTYCVRQLLEPYSSVGDLSLIAKLRIMKEFDPSHPKWQFCCCHITSAAYSIALVEFLASSLTAAVLIGLAVNNVISTYHRPFIIGGACLAFAWLFASVILILAIKKRHSYLIIPHIIMQGVAFCLMLVFMVSVFMSGRIEQTDGTLEPDQTSAQPGTLSIVMAVLFAAATLFVTVTMIYVLLKLKTYTKEEKKHEIIQNAIRHIAHPEDDQS